MDNKFIGFIDWLCTNGYISDIELDVYEVLGEDRVNDLYTFYSNLYKDF